MDHIINCDILAEEKDLNQREKYEQIYSGKNREKNWILKKFEENLEIREELRNKLGLSCAKLSTNFSYSA